MTDDQIRFRFFKDLNESQRLAVFKAFGVYPDDCTERLNHAIERRLLDAILKRSAAQTAPVNVTIVRLPDRVVDALISSAGVSTFHPDGSQREKLHSLVHGVTAEVLARLPYSATPSAPAAPSEDAKRLERLFHFSKTDGLLPVSWMSYGEWIAKIDAAIAATAQQKGGE